MTIVIDDTVTERRDAYVTRLRTHKRHHTNMFFYHGFYIIIMIQTMNLQVPTSSAARSNLTRINVFRNK